MPVNLSPPNPAQLYPIAGVRLGVAEAGIRKAHRKDLTVVLLEGLGSRRLHAEPVLCGTRANLP